MPLILAEPPPAMPGQDDPAVLRAACAGHHAAVAAVLPIIASAVSTHRAVLDLATSLPTEPVANFNAQFEALMARTAGAELREVLGELLDVLATVDRPHAGERQRSGNPVAPRALRRRGQGRGSRSAGTGAEMGR